MGNTSDYVKSKLGLYHTKCEMIDFITFIKEI